jgi:hypothetical protein
VHQHRQRPPRHSTAGTNFRRDSQFSQRGGSDVRRRVFDAEHSEFEERWFTLGMFSERGQYEDEAL